MPQSKREYFLVLVLALTGIFIFGWQTAGYTLYTKTGELRINRTHLQEEHALLKSTVLDKERIESAWALMQEEKERLETAIPDLAELPLVLGNLEALLESHSEAIHLLRINNTSYEDDYVTVGATLHLAAQPYRLQNILKRLEDFPHLIILDSLHWSNKSEVGSTLELNFRFIFISADQSADYSKQQSSY